MYRGIFGCPTKVVGYATNVILSSPFSTVGTIVGSVVESSVVSVQQIQFLHLLLNQGLIVTIGRRLGYVIIVSSNGNWAELLIIMEFRFPTPILVPHHQQQVWPALNLVALLTLAALLLLAQLGLINELTAVLVSALVSYQ